MSCRRGAETQTVGCLAGHGTWLFERRNANALEENFGPNEHQKLLKQQNSALALASAVAQRRVANNASPFNLCIGVMPQGL